MADAFAITTFRFDDQPVRTVIAPDGDPWFVASDICKVLSLSSHKGSYSQHLNKLDIDEKRAIPREVVQGTPESNMGVVAAAFCVAAGGAKWAEPMIWVVSESGAYSMIMRCREAMTPGTLPHRVRKWVTSEVLPSIRRTGRYELPTQPGHLKTQRNQAALPAPADARVIKLQAQLIRAQAVQIGLLTRLERGQRLHSAREAVHTVIDMARRGESREAMAAATGKTFNHIRQIIFRARAAGQLPNLSAQAQLDLEVEHG
jgi:prophage antirepressor-like protein